MYPPAGHPAMP
jgi:hypothetical protein